MNWKEKAEAFAKAGGTRSQKRDLDFIGRTILRGLGWPEKRLPLLATQLGIDADAVTTMDTAVDVLNDVSEGMFSPASVTRRFSIDTCQLRFTKAFLEGSKVEDRMAAAMQMPENGGIVSLFRSPKDEKRCMAAVFLHEPSQGYLPNWLLRPVTTLWARRDDLRVSLWTREASGLFRDMARDLGWAVPEAPLNDDGE